MNPSALVDWLKEQGLAFALPEMLWALCLIPVLALFYVGARQARRHVAQAFRVKGTPRRRSWRGIIRGVATMLLWLGLAAAVVAFARPIVEMPTPDDQATVVFVVDASLAMRATDVEPTRFEAAKDVFRAAIRDLPKHLQVALVGYSSAAYIVLPPTHDQGAAPAALNRMRTAEGAALGDALSVAVAAVPMRRDVQGNPSGGAAPTREGPPPKTPSAIVLLSSGDVTGGRDLADGVTAAREAGIPVHVVGIGPRRGADQKAPFDERTLRQIAQFTGGRFLAAPTRREWRDLFAQIGADVAVEVRPQEIGHFIGAGGLAIMGLAMLVSLAATRRLV
ncbi:MAG TPA: VWA domain-containing protein [Chloroflexota bacterium]|nr:VWA domain-containing protein [Chloroflexota bacterium]